MEENPQFTSRALEVNLAETRRDKVELTADHRRFLSLSVGYWGMHQRTEGFFRELNHTYPDYRWIIENLKKICLGDFWFYSNLPEAEEAFSVLITCFESLCSASLSFPLKLDAYRALVQFLGMLMDSTGKWNPLCLRIIKNIEGLLETDNTFVIQGSGGMKHLPVPSGKAAEPAVLLKGLFGRILEKTADYWEKTTNATAWIAARQHLFSSVDPANIDRSVGKGYLRKLKADISAARTWKDYTALPMYRDIAAGFRDFTDSFDLPLDKIYFLYYLLQLPGMSHLKDHLLRDMNRLLEEAFESLDEGHRIGYLDTVFTLFEELKKDHMATVLDCIQTLGISIGRDGSRPVIRHFTERLIEFGFVSPGAIRVDKDWQIQADPNHLKNIVVWLSIIEGNPSEMKKLLAALVVELRLGGVFIQDTDLFQKDISRLLNSDITGLYKMVKQLAVLFPVYFNEIGAEGELREVTTRLDELSGRQDRLIHFLRKQVHAESNSSHIRFIEAIIQYWYDGDLQPLLPFLPQDVVTSIDPRGPWFLPIHSMLKDICRLSGKSPRELCDAGEKSLNTLLSYTMEGTEKDKERLRLIFRLDWLLNEKYAVTTRNIIPALRKTTLILPPEVDRLERYMASNRDEKALKLLFKILERLKGVILNPEKSEGWENIYYKRHIAAGIPSMYGQYHEIKFEALGLTFRLEHTAGRLLEHIIEGVNLNYISLKNLKRVTDILELFNTGLELRGISGQSFTSNIQMLKYSLQSGSFSIDQYINIFQFFTNNIREIIDQYFISVYDGPLKTILRRRYAECLEEHELSTKTAQESETFYRDLLASSRLIQTLDTFVARILRTLRETGDMIPGRLIHQIMSFDPDLLVNPLYKPVVRTDNKVFLGAKAFYLKKLTSMGFPVPEGFVLTTELFRHKEAILCHREMEKAVDAMIAREIKFLERKTKRTFGDPDNPLFFSVRSGTAFSMPGAMNTFLNVGMNGNIAEKLSKKPGFSWAAWDCFRRLLQSWGMAYGIERDSFDWIMKDMKELCHVEKKRNFEPDQMRRLAERYYQLLTERGIEFENNPFNQLKKAILAVMNSWSSDRARVYREHLNIADEWGTAVLIQRMIFGNLDESAGTGVAFTSNPFGDKQRIRLFGDYIPCSQGEDVVSGLVHTLPISNGQWDSGKGGNGGESLENRFPEVYQQLQALAGELIDRYEFPHQEIEFTFESPGSVCILQTRPQTVRKQDTVPVFDPDGEDMIPAGGGIGIGGGALNGLVVFDLEDLRGIKKRYPEEKCVLLRPDTVPDDIEMVFACDGLLTSRGGVTSHAAVTAVQIGIVCVVNCRDLIVDEKKKIGFLQGIHFLPGDKIAIDGNSGNIYKGHYPLRQKGVVP